jgi:hypothetical protein
MSKTIQREFRPAASRTAKSSSASIHHINYPAKPGQPPNTVSSPRNPRIFRTEVRIVTLPLDLGGLPSSVRCTTCFANDVLQYLHVELDYNDNDSVSEEAVIHSELLSALEEMVDRMRGASLRNDHSSKQPRLIAELNLSIESSIRPRETMLRVGSLELDLVDRTARRGDRPIDLLPCEFRLLRCMMQRVGQLLTRATLLEDVWRYNRFLKTNLVDVHMGRLRRKVDGSNQAPMIRNVRGAGFILTAAS